MVELGIVFPHETNVLIEKQKDHLFFKTIGLMKYLEKDPIGMIKTIDFHDENGTHQTLHERDFRIDKEGRFIIPQKIIDINGYREGMRIQIVIRAIL